MPLKVYKPIFAYLCISKKSNKKNETSHSQISEIISNYTSSSKAFLNLQSLILNYQMRRERDSALIIDMFSELEGRVFYNVHSKDDKRED